MDGDIHPLNPAFGFSRQHPERQRLNPAAGAMYDAEEQPGHHQAAGLGQNEPTQPVHTPTPEVMHNWNYEQPVSSPEIWQNTAPGQPVERPYGKDYGVYSAQEYQELPIATSPRKPKGWLKRWWSSARWTKEIISIIISWILQGGIIIILACMSGKPQSSWHFFATINAVISIFTTAGKGTLSLVLGSCISQWKWFHFKDSPKPLRDFESYDSASRGTMGSIKFLYRMRWNVATVGALITILVFGFDPFYQQIVSFDTRDVLVPNNVTATYAFAHEYKTTALESAFSSSGFLAEKSTADNAMLAAIYRGIYNLGQSAISNCSSTCGWPGPYYSLGFRNTCSNVTEATVNAQQCSNLLGAGKQCNMTTPGGVHLKTVTIETEVQTIVVVNSTRLEVSNRTEMISDIMRVAVFRAPSPMNPELDIAGLEIVECTIDLVGIKTSDIRAKGADLEAGKSETISLNDTTVRFVLNETKVYFSKEGMPELAIGTADIGYIMTFFESGLFAGSMFDGYEPSAPAELRASEGVAGGFIQGDISAVFDKMVSSMNDHIRTGVNMQMAVGSSSIPEVFVQVNWVWITLPIAGELAGAVLLIMTIWHSKKHREVGLFKSSNLALLYHDVVASEGVLRTTEPNLGAEDMDDVGEVRAKLD